MPNICRFLCSCVLKCNNLFFCPEQINKISLVLGLLVGQSQCFTVRSHFIDLMIDQLVKKIISKQMIKIIVSCSPYSVVGCMH